MVAASDFHSASPLPGRVPWAGSTSAVATTSAPAARATAAVASVESESMTSSSSTSGSRRTQCSCRSATRRPTVAASLRAGQDDADPVAAAPLGPQQRVEIQLRQGGGGRRPVLEPGAGVGSHRLTVDQESANWPGTAYGNASEFTRSSPPGRFPRRRILRIPCGYRAVRLRLTRQSPSCTKGEQQGTRGKPAQDRGDDVTIRTDAALSRRVTGARLVTTLAVLGGTLALAGLGSFGDSPPAPSTGTRPRHRDRGAVAAARRPVGTAAWPPRSPTSTPTSPHCRTTSGR